MKAFTLVALMLSLCYSHWVWSHGSHEHKVEAINHAIDHAPENPILYIKRGIEHSDDGNYQQALKDFKKAQSLGEPSLVYFDLGVLHYRQSQFKQAKGYFDLILNKDKNNRRALEYRARVLRDLGDHGAALQDLQHFFSLRKDPNPGLFIAAADMALQSPKHGLTHALEILDQGMAKLGIIPQLQHYAITLLREKKRFKAAITRLQTLAPSLGQSPQWKFEMAKLLMLDKQNSQALTLIEQAQMQLQQLRSTPDRKKLMVRLQQLKRQSLTLS